MSNIISSELKADMESMYKTTGDLLNLLEIKDFSHESSGVRELINEIKHKLMDIEAILQKDIYNCDYIISKDKIQKTKY